MPKERQSRKKTAPPQRGEDVLIQSARRKIVQMIESGQLKIVASKGRVWLEPDFQPTSRG